MRTYIKAALMCLIAVFLAYALKTVGLNALGLNPESNALDDYSDMMLQARELFLEYSDDFQTLTAAISGEDGLHLFRAGDGTALAEVNGEYAPVADVFAEMGLENAQELAETADRLFTGTELTVVGTTGTELTQSETMVLSAYVSGGEVLYFTRFHERGCVGVCYSPSGEAGGFQTIELVEDWNIFYDIAE